MTTNIAVLPKDVLDAIVAQLERGNATATGARMLRLPHPRTGSPALFLPRPDAYDNNGATDVLEVQAVDPPNSRSWFTGDGQVLEDGRLLLMTPIDPVFLLIPILQSLPEHLSSTFRPLDDIFEDAVSKLIQAADAKDSLNARDVNRFVSLPCATAAARRICEVKDITPEITVYRYSQAKLLQHLQRKVARLARPEVFERSRTLIRNLAKDGLMEDGKESLLESARTRAACDLVGQYLPPVILTSLIDSYDFTALNAHLKSIQDELAALAAAAKPPKYGKNGKKKTANTTGGEEEKPKNGQKRKNNASTAVEKLKKANTKGMAKLSTFFQAKAKA